MSWEEKCPHQHGHLALQTCAVAIGSRIRKDVHHDGVVKRLLHDMCPAKVLPDECDPVYSQWQYNEYFRTDCAIRTMPRQGYNTRDPSVKMFSNCLLRRPILEPSETS